ncbi:MAG: hypothetical protein GF320_12045 [Armatimonadia bacterium]|nr:hypothetical protein [Armatimonadia bacterium]
MRGRRRGAAATERGDPMLRYLAAVMLLLSVAMLGCASGTTAPAASEPGYSFDGSISRSVLDSYLSRAVTHQGLLGSVPEPATEYFDDDLRMLTEVGAKFVGRALHQYTVPDDMDDFYTAGARRAARIHARDPEIIIQASLFETTHRAIETVPVPSWVFEAFDRPLEERSFDYEATLYDDGHLHDQWAPGSSVPDMTKIETRMWFYYRACRAIDAGCESIHFGMADFMAEADGATAAWDDLLTRVRSYAKTNARRHFVHCDAHTLGMKAGDRLLFDSGAAPLRIVEVQGQGMPAELRMGHPNSRYGDSPGGLTPSGWTCEHQPYLVEFDNWGSSGQGGVFRVGDPWTWGYDEISWLAHHDATYRAQWLRYAYNWIGSNDPNGHLQVCTRRVLHDPVQGRLMYHANRQSDACPVGFGDEDAIAALWAH